MKNDLSKKNIPVTKRRQHLTSLGPFLFAGGGDVATWCRESSSLVVIVPVEDVVMKVVGC